MYSGGLDYAQTWQEYCYKHPVKSKTVVEERLYTGAMMKKMGGYRVLAFLPNPAFFIDANNMIAYQNRAFEREFGNAIGKGYENILFGSNRSRNNSQRVIHTRSGRLFFLELLPYKDSSDVALQLGILKDITEIKRLEGQINYLKEINKGLNQIYQEQQKVIERLSHQALTDGLTGLYNHRHFWEMASVELKRANRYSEPLSCLMIDIDNFKFINDRFDHQNGDAVLKNIAKVLKEPLRATDILARYGGDEFAVLLPNTDYQGAHVISQKILDRVHESIFDVREASTNVTISLGASSYPIDHIMDSAQLVEYADAALYEAKTKGKDRVCFFHEMKSASLQ